MSIKKFAIPVAGIGALVATLLLKKKSAPASTNLISEVVVAAEETFGGITLSKLDKLAKEIYHGLSCTIDQWGFLVFHSKSKRGHQTFHTQMKLDETGKLINLGGHYSGQWCSSADEFAKRLINYLHSRNKSK